MAKLGVLLGQDPLTSLHQRLLGAWQNMRSIIAEVGHQVTSVVIDKKVPGEVVGSNAEHEESRLSGQEFGYG